MGKTTLTWEYDGLVGEGFKIYRADSPMDPEDLPLPIATVGIGVREYVDETVIDDATYYYRVASYVGGTERVSAEIEHTAEDSGDPYWDNVVALLYFDGDLTDETGRAWSLGSASVINTETPIFGTGSLETTGLGEGAYTSNPINDSSAAFCIETFMEIVTLPPPTNGYGATDWMAVWGQTNNSSNGEMGLWFYGNSIFLDLRAIGGGTTSTPLSTPLTTGVRYHLAQTYDGTTHRAFLNGELVASKTYSTGWGNTSQPFRIGQMYIPIWSQYRSGGYCLFDSLRITKGAARYTENFAPPTEPFPNFGTDPYWDNVVSLLRFQGANGSTTFTDEKGVIWTATGAVISDAQSSVGSTSGYFDGSSDITSESLASLELGTGDFTIEAVLRRNAGTAYQCFFDSRPSSAAGYGAYSVGADPNSLYPAIASNSNVIIWGTKQVPATTWTHVAFVRASGVVTLYINGTNAGSVADTRTLTGTQFRIGRAFANIQPFAGYIQQFRATKGVARYSGAFTPPKGLFPNFGN